MFFACRDDQSRQFERKPTIRPLAVVAVIRFPSLENFRLPLTPRTLAFAVEPIEPAPAVANDQIPIAARSFLDYLPTLPSIRPRILRLSINHKRSPSAPSHRDHSTTSLDRAANGSQR